MHDIRFKLQFFLSYLCIVLLGAICLKNTILDLCYYDIHAFWVMRIQVYRFTARAKLEIAIFTQWIIQFIKSRYICFPKHNFLPDNEKVALNINALLKRTYWVAPALRSFPKDQSEQNIYSRRIANGKIPICKCLTEIIFHYLLSSCVITSPFLSLLNRDVFTRTYIFATIYHKIINLRSTKFSMQFNYGFYI